MKNNVISVEWRNSIRAFAAILLLVSPLVVYAQADDIYFVPNVLSTSGAFSYVIFIKICTMKEMKKQKILKICFKIIKKKKSKEESSEPAAEETSEE